MQNQPPSKTRTIVREVSKSESSQQNAKQARPIHSWIISWLNNYCAIASTECQLTGQATESHAKIFGRITKIDAMPTQVHLIVDDGFGSVCLPVSKKYTQQLPELLSAVSPPLSDY